MPDEVQQVMLPDSVMEAITAITESGMPPEKAYTAVVILAFGWALWQRQEEFDPTSVQIPKSQWLDISGALVSMKGSDIDRVNWGLAWMNQGPSAYTPVSAG
jgi:hypothetical protein